MRNVLIASVAFVLGSAAAGSAIAGEGTSPQGQIQTFETSQERAAKSPPTGQVGAKVRIQTTLRRADGSPASAWNRLELYFPRGMTIDTKRFPKCDRSRLLVRGVGACPKRSLVGAGTLTGDGRPVVDTVSAKVRVYNGKKRTLLLYVRPTISSPLVIEFQLHRQARGPFG